METGVNAGVMILGIPIEAWFGILAAAILFFDRLAKITPTKKDDEAVSYLYRLFAVLGVKVPDVQGGPKK